MEKQNEWWGPWAGMYRQPITRRRWLKHRSWFLPIFIMLAIIVTVTAGLVALSGIAI